MLSDCENEESFRDNSYCFILGFNRVNQKWIWIYSKESHTYFQVGKQSYCMLSQSQMNGL